MNGPTTHLVVIVREGEPEVTDSPRSPRRRSSSSGRRSMVGVFFHVAVFVRASDAGLALADALPA